MKCSKNPIYIGQDCSISIDDTAWISAYEVQWLKTSEFKSHCFHFIVNFLKLLWYAKLWTAAIEINTIFKNKLNKVGPTLLQSL